VTTPSAEVLAGVKSTLQPGDILDGGGGYTCYGVAEKAEIAREEGFLPLGLAEGIKVVQTVPPHGLLRYEDVELDEDSFLLQQRRIQDRTFW
jgi:predicted homoserine dehydrogenase-like protein